jgi:hypothetical protein
VEFLKRSTPFSSGAMASNGAIEERNLVLIARLAEHHRRKEERGRAAEAPAPPSMPAAR